MTRKLSQTVLLTGVTTLTVLALGGCATSTPDRSAKAVDSMSQTFQAKGVLRDQLVRTLASLEAVMAAEPEQLRAAYDTFTEDVKKLSAEAKSGATRLKDMKAKKESYVKAWEKEKKEVSDPELRKVADTRHQQVVASLDTVIGELDGMRAEFDAMLSNLNDVDKVLGGDLTLKGQEMVRSTQVVQNAKKNGDAVLAAIDRARTELEKVASDLSPTGTME